LSASILQERTPSTVDKQTRVLSTESLGQKLLAHVITGTSSRVHANLHYYEQYNVSPPDTERIQK